MITTKAKGSLSFVLEEFRPDAPLRFDEKMLVAKALDRTQVILQASLDDNDELLSENKTVFSLRNNKFTLVFRGQRQ